MPSWFAVSTWSGRRSRFGTAASFDGIHTSAQQPMRKLPMNSHTGEPTTAIETNSPHRSTSATTMILRRSKRSASRPPIGANSRPGSSCVSTTPGEGEGLRLVALGQLGDQTGQRQQ